MTAARPAKGVVVNVSPGKEPSDKQQAQEGNANKGKGSKGKGSSSNDPPDIDLDRLNAQLASRFPSIAAFPFASHIGKIGMGSGVYLGDGYVLTSAHVGCYPFVAQDGTIYRPDYQSWRVLEQAGGAKADLAIFRIKIEDPDSSLAMLSAIPLASRHPEKDDMVVLIGSGLVQDANPVVMKSGEKIIAVLGYRIEGRRGAVGGLNTVSEIISKPIQTKDFQTDCYTTNFDRDGFEAQAVDGDSGGASFVYNRGRGRWELAGCIIAVSQADGFVPFGSRTYLANLARYAKQLPHASGDLEVLFHEGLAEAADRNLSDRVIEESIQVRPATIEVTNPEPVDEADTSDADGMMM